MKHYSSEEWADFARDVGDADQKAGMQRHLHSGCVKCKEELVLWQRVHSTARRQACFEVPESVLRTVKGAFSLYGPASTASAKPTIAELIFDSFRSPHPVGVRAASIAPRQLLYGAGDHRIDLRFEPEVGSEKLSLIGQILNSTSAAGDVDALPVVLMRGRQIIGGSSTNEFGEFHLGGTFGSGLELRIRLPHGKEVFIPLIELVAESAANTSDLTESKGVNRNPKKAKKSSQKKS
jgi:hypothetical protein